MREYLASYDIFPAIAAGSSVSPLLAGSLFKTYNTMNTKRFLSLLKWNIIGNKRSLLNTILRFGAGIFLINCLCNISSWIGGLADFNAVSIAAKLCAVLFPVVMMAFASELTFNLRTKQTIINYSMLPASNLEKYLSNFLVKTILSALLFFVGLLLADCLQALLTFVIAKTAYFLTPLFFTHIVSFFSSMPEALFLFLLFVHSTFAVASSFFRRRPLLWTTLLWILIPMLISFCAGAIFEVLNAFAERNGYVIVMRLHYEDKLVQFIAGLVTVLISAFNYWLSYRLFCRIQVINNKVHN